MAKYLDPKADLTFKKVFGEQPEILRSFLNAILPLPEGREIKSLEYLSNEMVPDNPMKKYSFFSVACYFENDEKSYVQIHNCWSLGLVKYEVLDTAKAYVRPLEKGESYSELREVYSVCLINDIAFDELKNEFYHRYGLENILHPEFKISGFELVFVELPKFRPSTIADKKMMVLWLKFLTEINEHTQAIEEGMLEDENISKAIEIVEQSAYTDSQMMAYDKFWDEIRCEKSLMRHFKEEGRAEGRAEERLSLAKKMKAMGVLSVQQIADVTNLSVEDIERL